MYWRWKKKASWNRTNFSAFHRKLFNEEVYIQIFISARNSSRNYFSFRHGLLCRTDAFHCMPMHTDRCLNPFLGGHFVGSPHAAHTWLNLIRFGTRRTSNQRLVTAFQLHWAKFALCKLTEKQSLCKRSKKLHHFQMLKRNSENGF